MDQERIKAAREKQRLEAEKKARQEAAANRTAELQKSVESGSAIGAKSTLSVKDAVEQSGAQVAKSMADSSKSLLDGLSQQNGGMTEALNNLVVATVMSRDPELVNVVKNFTDLLNGLSSATDKLKNSPLNKLPSVNADLVKALDSFTKQASEKEEPDYTSAFDNLQQAIESLDIKPVVNVPSQQVNIDLASLIKSVKDVQKAVTDNKVTVPEVNFDSVIVGLEGVQTTLKSLKFPVPNYVLPFRDQDGKAVQVQLDSSNRLPVDANINLGDIEIGQVKLLDSGGTTVANMLKSDGTAVGQNALMAAGAYLSVAYTTTTVQAVASTDAGNYRYFSVHPTSQGTSSVTTLQVSNDNVNWVTAAGLTASATGTNSAATTASAAGTIVSGPLKARYFRLNVTAISAGTTAGTVVFWTIPPNADVIGAPSILGSATNTTGSITTNATAITSGNVSAYSGFAVISIHGTYAGISFGITASDDNSVTFYNVPVFNASAGFWLQPGATITPAANASVLYYVPIANNSGGTTIKVLSSAYTSGTGTIRIGNSSLPNNPGSTMSQIVDSAGNGRGANVDANSNLGVVLPAETTKAIGVVRNSDGSGNLVTSNSTTYTAKFALDSNLLGTLGTAFTAAGKVNVHGAVATNVAITDNPLNLGAQGVSSENAAVTTARQAQLVSDLVGKLIVLPYANPENFTMGTTAAITDTTSTSTIAAQGAGVRTYITQITVSNSHATVGTFVKILDGSTIIHEAYAAAAGGGYTATFPTPLKGTANTAVNTQNVTTGANVISTVSGYKGI